MAKIGRPLKTINWDEFDKLVSYQCTQAEIAAFFDMDIETVDALCLRERGESFSVVWHKKRAFGRTKLRKFQMQIVEKGGPGAATMAIYLDKKMFPDERVDLPTPTKDPSAPGPTSSPTPTNVQAYKTYGEFVAAAGYPPPFDKQIEMKDFAINENDPRLLLGFRGCGKTDYVTVLGIAYDVYLHYMLGLQTSNLIISKSKSRNTAMIEEIANALKCNGVELEKQNSTCIRVKGHKGKDHSVETLTIKSSFRGRHPFRIVMDDPVTEEDTSEAMRTLVKKKFDEAYKLSKNIVIIGQPAHAFDLYAELRPKLRRLEVPHGEIPELDADLEAMKLAGVDENSISMSYHLVVPTEGSSIFANLKWLDQPFGNTDSVAFIDPSEGGDFTAVSMIRGYMAGAAVKGHAWKRAWFHCIDELTKLFVAHGVKRVCFETNSTGNNPLVQLRTVWGPLGITVVGKRSDSNKHAVIQSAGSYSHMIHLSKESDRVYTEQVVRYELGVKNDDAPDSMARGLEWLGLLRGKT